MKEKTVSSVPLKMTLREKDALDAVLREKAFNEQRRITLSELVREALYLAYPAVKEASADTVLSGNK